MSTTPPFQIVPPSPFAQASRPGHVAALKEKIETGLFVICYVRLAECLIEHALLD
ncbi:MAG TPA: hypothetical protein VLV83_04580 [Acidobacteriota bacterium]|nr:hypothetical protein [Acidobacteriota bacterium]